METLRFLRRKLNAYVTDDPERDRSHDRYIAAGIMLLVFASVFGVANLVQTLGPMGQVSRDGSGKPVNTTIRTDPLGLLATTTTVPEMAPPTGAALGPSTTAVETTIPFAEELPGEATSEPFARLGPARPTGLSPASGASVRTLSPLLKWTESSGATAYYVEMARDPAVSGDGYYLKPVAFDQLVSEGEWRLPAITESGTYYWHVGVGVKGQYKPSFSPSYRVHITASPQVIGPSGGSSAGQNQLRLRWEELDGAESYMVEIAEDTAGDDLRGYTKFVRRESYIKALEYSPPRPLPPGRYFWHVRGIDADNARGDFSASHEFRVTAQ